MSVKLSGPAFQAGEVRRAFRTLEKSFVTAATQQGKREVKARLWKKHGVDSGAFKRGRVHGRVTQKGPNRGEGKVFASNVMIGLWLEGGSRLIRRKTRFMGYNIFRDARANTERAMPKIATDAANKAAKRLNGQVISGV